jgi:hypothetical protein
MTEAADERMHPAVGEGFADAVTFAFGDAGAERYGLARIGVRPGEPASASVLAIVFAGEEVAAAVAEDAIAVPRASWEEIAVAGVRMWTLEPLRAWRVALEGADAAFDLELTASCEPLELGPGDPVASAGGVAGYEQLCRVQGTVTAGGGRREVRCLGQRGHWWGAADWERIQLARTVCAWWDEAHAVMLSAVRPAGASAHDEEALSAFLLDDGEGARAVAEPRLSTTYDAAGRQRRAGLELWVGEDDELPRRAAGEVACGSSLELGRLRLDCAFFHWRMEGRDGVGRYDVLRRA